MEILTVKPMKKLILIILISLSLHSFNSFGQLDHVLIKEDISSLKINGLTVIELSNPGINFEKLKVLGQLQDSSYSKTITEEIWKLYYSGITLTYVDRHGKPELHSFEVNSFDKLKIQLREIKLNNQSTKQFDLEGNSRDKIQTIFINEHTSQPEKFGDNFHYLEMILDSNKNIKSLKFESKVD